MRNFFLISMLSLFIFCSTGYAELLDNGDGTVTDTKTGLMWQQAEAGIMTWKAALAYSDTLVLAGYSDWRLPDPSELQSLFDALYDNSSINRTAFPDMSMVHWSSTTNADATDRAMTVSFYAGDGSIYSGIKQNSRAVKAVRGGQ